MYKNEQRRSIYYFNTKCGNERSRSVGGFELSQKPQIMSYNLLSQCDWKWRTLCVGMPLEYRSPFTSPLERVLLPCFYGELALLTPPWCRSNPASFLASKTLIFITFHSGDDMSSLCTQLKIDSLDKGLLPYFKIALKSLYQLITKFILSIISHRPLHSITLD